ncbi:hypothetical protein chiPu_0026441 [Chiloscyllium punctatum]|uniref:Uncharacterized protein n=1 Tax=Chiloscyllium punctatum TaxID=137246 RepID=A0A401THK5_CHIPU|nr:hypothetical protein [Chiloscyllium punctatum]
MISCIEINSSGWFVPARRRHLLFWSSFRARIRSRGEQERSEGPGTGSRHGHKRGIRERVEPISNPRMFFIHSLRKGALFRCKEWRDIPALLRLGASWKNPSTQVRLGGAKGRQGRGRQRKRGGREVSEGGGRSGRGDRHTIWGGETNPVVRINTERIHAVRPFRRKT